MKTMPRKEPKSPKPTPRPVPWLRRLDDVVLKKEAQ